MNPKKVRGYEGLSAGAYISAVPCADCDRWGQVGVEDPLAKVFEPLYAAAKHVALCEAQERWDVAREATKRKAAPADFRQTEPDPDHSTLHCPCGSDFTWSGFSNDLGPWRREHEPHLTTQDKREDDRG